MTPQTLPALLREEAAELLALFPAARRAAAGGPAGGEAPLDSMARAAYRMLRLAENAELVAALSAGEAKPEAVCISQLTAAYVSGAAGVCRFARFVPAWPERPVWTPGHPRFFAAALGSLLADLLARGGERPVVGAQLLQEGKTARLTLTRPAAADTPDAAQTPAGADAFGLAAARCYAAWCGGRVLYGASPEGGVSASLCLPVCPPGAAEEAPAYAADRFSALYVQLAGVCDLPV